MKPIESVPTKKTACPCCGYVIDCAACPERPGAKPRPGDLSLCLGCAEVLAFNQDMTLREATIEDLMQLSPQQQAELGRAQKFIRTVKPPVTRP